MIDQPVKSSSTTSPENYIEALLSKTQNNRELAITLFSKLFKQLPEQLENIDQALQLQDISRAKDISHDLHGSVGFCGFTSMQKEAQQLEKMLIDNNLTTINEQLLSLKKLINQFIEFEKPILSSLS